MNAGQRFQETLSYGTPDRAPLFEEGIRDEVLASWHHQGLPAGSRLDQVFVYDRREEIEPDLDPSPGFSKWLGTANELNQLRRRLDACDPRRLPSGWQEKLEAWKERDHVLMLRVHRGFFLSMGVAGWKSFAEVIRLTVDQPAFVRKVMMIQGEFAAALAERILSQVEVDAAIFSEPISGSHGPLISPDMYQDLVLESYRPLLDVLSRYQVQAVVCRTYANPAVLLPKMVAAGFNCLWACERHSAAMDYLRLRYEYGRQLRLMGGFDADILRESKAVIQAELERVLPVLLPDGGFFPLLDGRVREGVPYENYVFYRTFLEKMMQSNLKE